MIFGGYHPDIYDLCTRWEWVLDEPPDYGRPDFPYLLDKWVYDYDGAWDPAWGLLLPREAL